MNFHRVDPAGLVSVVLTLSLALFAAPAYCQTEAIVVDSLADIDDGDFSPGNLTLREAVGLANSTEADVITFAPGLTGGTIILTEGELGISSSMTINGLGADALSISALGASRVIAEVGSGQRIITLRDLTLADGLAPSGTGGGALFTNGGNITLERVVMSNNNSLGNNGSTIVAAFGTLDIKECAIVDNLSTGVGAIRLQDNRTTIVNTTISNNQTRAISVVSASSSDPDILSLTNVTISGNANEGIEIVALAGTTDFEYQNTIFSNNGSTSIDARGNALEGLSITSLGNNLLDDSPTGDAAHSAAPGDLRDTDPMLDLLADYGGATLSMRPLPGSPAVDAGACFADDPLVPEHDQRGAARPQGEGCDIGAVEFAHVGVAFAANGGAPAPGTQVLLEGALVTEPAAMTRTGHSFGGWFAASDFSGAPWNFASETAPFNDLVLFARWLPNLFDLDYAANGDQVSGLPPAQTDLAFGSTVTVSAIVPVRIGHDFAGWNTAADSSGNAFAPGAAFSVPASDTTLFAQWTLRRFTLRYLPAEHCPLSGEVEQRIAEGEDGSAVRVDPEPGFRFVRWSDGVTDNPRIDRSVVAALEVTAECVETVAEVFSDGFE